MVDTLVVAFFDSTVGLQKDEQACSCGCYLFFFVFFAFLCVFVCFFFLWQLRNSETLKNVKTKKTKKNPKKQELRLMIAKAEDLIMCRITKSHKLVEKQLHWQKLAGMFSHKTIKKCVFFYICFCLCSFVLPNKAPYTHTQ